jgi:hypothetical protein
MKYILIILFFSSRASDSVTFEKFRTLSECESVRKSFNILAEKNGVRGKDTECVAIDKYK